MTQDKQPPKSHRLIDENIKRVYQEALQEEVPDKFRQLLDQLRSQESRGSGN